MIKIYDLNMSLVAYLENAFAIGYEQRMNELWTASFSLPADDPKNTECLPLRFVEIYDAEERIDLFRIIPTKTQRSIDGETITYQCEHVLASLLDDVLFQYYQYGGLGVYTSQALQFVLDHQTINRWQLGAVNFTHQFEYKWENENLLGSLFSIPKPFIEAYHWTWDTTTSPWTLNLVQPESGDPSCYIRYGKNLQGITKDEDPTYLCTRLYCLGFGEGVNQLRIDELNGGLPYLDAATQAQYGIVSRIFADRRFESAETLKARGQALLDEMKIPRLMYTVEAAELYQLTSDPIDKFIAGALVRMIDEELGIDVISRVISVKKPDLIGEPWNAQIEIANKTADVAQSISELENRQRINEVYAQGATNIDSHDFADNCDPTHPAMLKFYVPAEAVRINKLTLSYQAEAFRAYSKAIEGGGAIATTTAAGGSTTVSSNATTAQIDRFQGATLVDGIIVTGAIAVSSESVDMIYSASGDGQTELSGTHNHGGAVADDGQHDHFVVGFAHNHQARYHTHRIDHTHSIQIPSHVHNFQLPNHTHGIDYGIFEGPTPTGVSVKVDGNAVSGLGANGSDVDLVPFMAKDSDGKVTRGAWHTIEIAPNSLGRIVATVISQIFVQSRGGGNY